jgi:predicted flap endonuclease-1-like 5' DNA nuclease
MSEAFPDPTDPEVIADPIAETGADDGAETGAEIEAGPGPSLAARLAERSRQRALRAERLARLRPPAPALAPAVAVPTDEAETALQEFLRALTGDLPVPETAAAGTRTAAAEVLAFQRPEPDVKLEDGAEDGVSDLEALPGVGPNLVWALEQAGIGCLADLVPLEPADLVARLGPIGRLVPAAGWIAAARAATLPG